MTTKEIAEAHDSQRRDHATVTTIEEDRERAQAAPRAEHYAEQRTHQQDHEPRTKRSRTRTELSHRGITILRCRPASGRRGTSVGARDLDGAPDSMFGVWSEC